MSKSEAARLLSLREFRSSKLMFERSWTKVSMPKHEDVMETKKCRHSYKLPERTERQRCGMRP